MKHMPYYMSFLGFFLTLGFLYLIGSLFNLNFLLFYYSKENPTEKVLFESAISFIPIILAGLVSYFSWKIGKRNFKRDV